MLSLEETPCFTLLPHRGASRPHACLLPTRDQFACVTNLICTRCLFECIGPLVNLQA